MLKQTFGFQTDLRLLVSRQQLDAVVAKPSKIKGVERHGHFIYVHTGSEMYGKPLDLELVFPSEGQAVFAEARLLSAQNTTRQDYATTICELTQAHEKIRAPHLGVKRAATRQLANAV